MKCKWCHGESETPIFDVSYDTSSGRRIYRVCYYCAHNPNLFTDPVYQNIEVVNSVNGMELYLGKQDGMVYERIDRSHQLLREFQARLKVEYPYLASNAWLKVIDDSYILVAVVGNGCFVSSTCDTAEECFDALTVGQICGIIGRLALAYSN